MEKWRFPAEYEPHEATMMIWPVRPGSWGKNPEKAQAVFLALFEAILQDEALYLLAREECLSEVVSAVSTIQAPHSLHILPIPTDDSWARDIGPTFVVNESRTKRAGIDWRFNAWGGEVDGLYPDYEMDDRCAKAFLSLLGEERIDRRDLVLEGGSIHTDGEGTLMVTESCLLSAGRNPKLSKKEIEEKLLSYLSCTKMLWLPRGIYGDETNEHVDNMAAFAGPGRILVAVCEDREDPQYALSEEALAFLSTAKDAKGRDIAIIPLPVPKHPVCVTKEEADSFLFAEGEDVREPGERLAASYVNFYLTNKSVLMPAFGGENEESDRKAEEILQKAFPDRLVKPFPAREILLGGGNIHCITQQIPAVKKT